MTDILLVAHVIAFILYADDQYKRIRSWLQNTYPLLPSAPHIGGTPLQLDRVRHRERQSRALDVASDRA